MYGMGRTNNPSLLLKMEKNHFNSKNLGTLYVIKSVKDPSLSRIDPETLRMHEYLQYQKLTERREKIDDISDLDIEYWLRLSNEEPEFGLGKNQLSSNKEELFFNRTVLTDLKEYLIRRMTSRDINEIDLLTFLLLYKKLEFWENDPSLKEVIFVREDQ